MKKNLIAILLAVLTLCVQMAVPAGAAALPGKWEAPGGLILTDNSSDSFSLKLTYNKGADLSEYLSLKIADQLAKYGYSCGKACLQVDWTVDSNTDGWKYHQNWDVIKNGCSAGNTNWEYWQLQMEPQTTDSEGILRLLNEGMWGWNDPVTGIGRFLTGKTYTKKGIGGKIYHYIDLTKHTVYARARFALMVQDAQRNKSYVLSDWSEIAAIGKDAGNGSQKPTNLETPVLSNLVLTNEIVNGAPVAAFNLSNPAQVKQASTYAVSNGERCIVVSEVSVNNGLWVEVGLINSDVKDGVYKAPLFKAAPKTDKNTNLRLRAYYMYKSHLGSELFRSGYSNIVEFGAPAWGKSSAWAGPELSKAAGYDLIPDILKGADMTKPITREEFAELAVKLYEKTTGKASTAASPNPFTDTTNPQILKAFKLGITTGTSATTFAPKELTNREQVATMLSRAIRVMAPGKDFSTAGAPSFSDQKEISSWALEHVLVMAKLEIIKGSSGKFMPKATTTAQKASGYATTTREQAIAMSVRAYEAMPTSGSSGKGADGSASNGTTGFNGKWNLIHESYENLKYTLSINQSGSNVTGTYTDYNQNSSGVTGTIAGNVLTVSIDNAFFKGWNYVLKMNADNKSFTGEWTNTKESHKVTGKRE